jgi:hypothetical protein
VVRLAACPLFDHMPRRFYPVICMLAFVCLVAGSCPSTMLPPLYRWFSWCFNDAYIVWIHGAGLVIWYDVIRVVQCAGNRRTEMSKSRKVRGVGWDVCALGNG